MNAHTSTNILAGSLLRLMAANFNLRPSLKEQMRTNGSWLNFSVGFRTEAGSVEQTITFEDGKARVRGSIPGGPDVTMIFSDDSVVKEMLSLPPNEVLNLLLKSRFRLEGNLSYMNLFNYYLSLLLAKKHRKMIEKAKARESALRAEEAGARDPSLAGEMRRRKAERLKAPAVDPGVRCLEDPYLSEYSLEDFPRLVRFVDIHHTQLPEVCCERSSLLTDWFLENGFETDARGEAWFPELRQGHAFKHLMENREPVIRKNDLLAGTTTTKEIGVVVYPDTHGTMIWGELGSVPDRPLNPYAITSEARDVFHHKVFPFWSKRNMREWVRETYDQPLSQKMDERFAVYFMWKTAALSHTILDFPKLLRIGTSGLIREIEEELEGDHGAGQEKRDTLRGMILCLEGLSAYAANLAHEAAKEASA
ncbi:MAG: pyruvate formate lyase family protein, partial [Candidatus Geothermincolia bacterium]